MIAFSLGQYVCRIETELFDDYLTTLFSGFEQIACETTSDIENTVSVHDLDSISVEKCGDGWHHDLSGNTHQVVYSEAGVVLFVIVYSGQFHGVQVYIRKKSVNHLKMALQFGLLVSLSDRAIGLHGVTLICKDKAVILSAPSGTGKTTLAKLLRTYTESGIVNGDFALLSFDEAGNVIFEPTPFCGTSGRCLNYRLKITGVVFLKQAVENSWRKLSVRETLIKLFSNTFVPAWDENIRLPVETNVITLSEAIPFWEFAFEPTKEAAVFFFNQLLSETESFTE